MTSDIQTITRRQFIANAGIGLSSFVFSPMLLASRQNPTNLKDDYVNAANTKQLFLAATGDSQQSYGMSWTSAIENQTATRLTNFRGHSVDFNPRHSNFAILFGRRPSKQLIRIQIPNNKIDKVVSCEANRHFFGHGCFSHDGKKLYTSEASLTNEGKVKAGEGIIGVRDPDTLQKTDEFKSFGIGPHEIKFIPNTDTLVVANGGLLTRPQSGRTKLNLNTMQSNLSYVDVRTKRLIEVASVPESKASIRHIDITPDGTVAIAMQFQREAAGHNKTVALSASHRMGNDIQLFEQPETLISQMNDYAGSVAVHPTNRVAGFTSPKGNVAAFWNVDTGRIIGYHSFSDVCGICLTQDINHFALSNSRGQIRLLDVISLKEKKEYRRSYQNIRWDNHLTSMTL
ncbi:MAG: DUF1513 domain-containing protein [Kangiellaceae bacterium]|nr:DUF1513 domain-containing protein [Kangiellaceae bacterium]